MEIWKDVPDYEGIYQVSNEGNVRSLDRYFSRKNYNVKLKGVGLKKILNKNRGYYGVKLSKNGKVKTRTIHQLVAMAFLNHKPNGKFDLVVDHIDNDKLNNKLHNLQVITNRENSTKDIDKTKTKSKYVGVSKYGRKYYAYMVLNGRCVCLGSSYSEKGASTIYNNKLIEVERTKKQTKLTPLPR